MNMIHSVGSKGLFYGAVGGGGYIAFGCAALVCNLAYRKVLQNFSLRDFSLEIEDLEDVKKELTRGDTAYPIMWIEG